MFITWPSIKSRPITLEFEIPISRTKKFWDHLKKGELYTTKCRICGRLHFPPVADCPSCRSSDMVWVTIEGKGELETFTHVIARPTSFQQRAPYTIAIANLDEGIKILAWLTNTEITEVEVGMKVKLEAGITPEGELSYWFVPA